jgi:predicted ATPase
LPRHQTLRATLDWSYELLSDAQKLMLQRLAVCAGTFELECAARVFADERIRVEDATQAILELSAKSLVTADVVDDEVVYRLLDTTRAYALEKLRDSGELRKIRLRHAEAWSAQGAGPFFGHTHPHNSGAWLAAFGRKIDDIQGALCFCFSADSGAPAVLKLTLASLWFEVVLISEFNGELELALETADERPAAGQALQTHLGVALEGALSSITGTVRGFTIAQQLGETVSDRRAVFSGLWIGRLAGRDYRCAGLVSDRFAQSNASTEDTKMLPDRMLMVVHHYAGKQALARHHAERVLSQSNDGALTSTGKALQCCHPRALRSRILWLQGFPEQAAQSAHVAVAEGMAAGEPLLACYALVCAILVMVLVGNIAEARRLTQLLRDYSVDHSVSYYELWAGCLEIAIAVRNGEDKIDRRLEASKSPQLGSYLDILSTLSDDLVSVDAIARAESGHGGWCEGESLRVKAQRLLKEHGARAFAESEALILRALEIAHRQSALSLELRAAMSLARLWREQNRIREARELLASVYARFTEGFETADLVEARSLLDEIPE